MRLRVGLKTEYVYVMFEYLCAFLIVGSYLSTRYISLFAAIVAALFILIAKSDDQPIAILVFLLPFSGVFTFSMGTTSLYMLLRIACICRLFFRRRISIKFALALLIFAVYCLFSMFAGNTSGITRIINLIIWFLVGLSIVEFSGNKSRVIVSRSFAQGTILSCIIGYNMSLIPNLQREVVFTSYLNESTGEFITRFSGLWNDPNGLTVLIVSAMFLIGLCLNRKEIHSIEFYIYTLVLTVFGLLTLSKSCIILIIVFWMYMLLSKSEIKIFQKVVILGIGSVAIIYMLFSMSDTVLELVSRFTSARTSSTGITSGRTDLWKMYFNNMSFKTWIIGNGINFELPYGRAAHNTLIQVVYNIGVFGGLIWFGLFSLLYKFTYNCSQKRLVIPLLSLMTTMFFLDGMFIELFYILLPLMFVCSVIDVSNDKC